MSAIEIDFCRPTSRRSRLGDLIDTGDRDHNNLGYDVAASAGAAPIFAGRQMVVERPVVGGSPT
jgi:hypothetical protein